MNRWTIVLLAFWWCGDAYAQEDPLRLGMDVSRSAKVIDLAETPPGIWLLQELSLSVTEKALQQRFSQEVGDFQKSVESQISVPGVGYLVEIRMFSDEFGTPIVPGGNILVPIGVGTEPLDSLAEWYRVPQLSSAPAISPTWSDESYYLWIVRKDGALKAWSINKAFRDDFRSRAMVEAKRRARLGSWFQASEGQSTKIGRASYWLDVYRERERLLREDTDKKKIESLNQQMSKLEDDFNTLYGEYRRTQAKLAKDQGFLAAMDSAAVVAGLLRGALEESQVSPPRSNSAPTTSTEKSTIEWIRREVSIEKKSVRTLEERVRFEYDGLKDLDRKFDAEYRRLGLPIPSRDWPLDRP